VLIIRFIYIVQNILFYAYSTFDSIIDNHMRTVNWDVGGMGKKQKIGCKS